MSGRTPGPWHVDGRRVGTDASCVALLCEFDSFGGIHDAANADANGHLLAAAPELLDLVRFFASMHSDDIRRYMIDEVQKAQALLARIDAA